MIAYSKETVKKISKTVLDKGIVPAFNAAYEFDRKRGGRMVKNFFKSFEWLYATGIHTRNTGQAPCTGPEPVRCLYDPYQPGYPGG